MIAGAIELLSPCLQGHWRSKLLYFFSSSTIIAFLPSPTLTGDRNSAALRCRLEQMSCCMSNNSDIVCVKGFDMISCLWRHQSKQGLRPS